MANSDQDKYPKIDVKVHRQVLRFLNDARWPDDLMHRPIREIPLHDGRLMEGVHEDQSVKESKRISLFDKELAQRVLQERDKISPIYGFQQWKKGHVAEVILG